MKKLPVQMTEVQSCSVTSCAYNANSACHAKAITIGDERTPECDTFFASITHARDVGVTAGVGACKVAGCQFNKDFECTAGNIRVGTSGNCVCCLTYQPA